MSWTASGVLLLVLAAPAASATQELPVVLGGAAGWTQPEQAATALVEIADEAELREEPTPGSPVLAVLAAGRMPLLEVRGSWVRVRSDAFEGWVDLDGEPTRRSEARFSTSAMAAEKEPLLELGFQLSALGPYTLHSEHATSVLRDELGLLAREHLRLYLERYGLKSGGGEVGGDILLFSDEERFREFTNIHAPLVMTVAGHHDAYFQAPDRIVILRDRRSRRELVATLAHELTHLLNWQLLVLASANRDSIPVWLDEGLAEDLALATRVKGGRLRADGLDHGNMRYGQRLGFHLNEVELRVRQGDVPTLAALVEMGRTEFWADELTTFLSALWIRFLLDAGNPERAQGFHSFLGSFSADPDADDPRLGRYIGESPATLDGAFESWIRLQRARFFS